MKDFKQRMLKGFLVFFQGRSDPNLSNMYLNSIMENMEDYLQNDGQRDSKFYIGEFTTINDEINNFIKEYFKVLERDYFYMNDSTINERSLDMFKLMCDQSIIDAKLILWSKVKPPKDNLSEEDRHGGSCP